MTTLDRNGQPLENFNARRNRDKLLNNLIGILDGIVADGVIDEQEMLYLDTWLKECAGRRDWVLRELSNLVSDVLADGVITEDEKLHLMSVIPQFMESLHHLPGVDFYSQESDKLLLEGLCKGVAGDQHLSDAEIRYMKWWMTQNSLLRAHYPGKMLYQTVERILEDGVITEEEREELHQQVLLFVGNPFEHGAVDGMATRLAVSDLEIEELEDKGVCFTGAFISGSRYECMAQAERLGAIPHPNVTKKVDYLIIGELSSRDWRFSSYGRKIEKAMEQQEKGHHIKIVTEEAWLDYVREVTA